MKYEQTYLDIIELAERIKVGYNFCHYYKNTEDIIFGNKEKRTDNFKETFIVCFDIDKSPLTYGEFYSNVTLKPSLSYTTPSNVDREDNRYRLIYQFNKPILNNEFYKELFDGIISSIKTDIPEFELLDKSCRNVTQQMGGNASLNIQYNLNKYVYNFSDFIKDVSNNSAPEVFPLRPSEGKEKRYVDAVGKNEKEELDCIEIKDLQFKNDFFNIIDFETYTSFREKYINTYPIFNQTPLPEVNDDTPLIELPEDFTIIKRDWLRVSDTKRNGDAVNYSYRVKIRAGDRHRILFSNAMLRRKMVPDISFEHLLFCLAWERQEFIDNTDKAITNVELYKICRSAFSAKEVTIKTKKDKRKYVVNEAFCDKYGYSKQEVAAKTRGLEIERILNKEYRTDLSVTQNIGLLKEKGYSIGKSTIYRYCESNGIPTKGTPTS